MAQDESKQKSIISDDTLIEPEPNDIVTHHADNSSTKISLDSFHSTSSDNENRDEIIGDNTSKNVKKLYFVNNLSNMSDGDYRKKQNKRLSEHLDHIQSTEEIENPDDKSDSSSFSSRQRKETLEEQNKYASDINDLKIDIDSKDIKKPSTVNTKERTESVIHSQIQKKSSSFEFTKLTCLIITTFLVGFACMVFGGIELYLDKSSVLGWTAVALPIVGFILFLVARCYLCNPTNIQSNDNIADQVEDRSPNSTRPI